MDTRERLSLAVLFDAGRADGKERVGRQCVQPGIDLQLFQRLVVCRDRHDEAIRYGESRLPQQRAVERLAADRRPVFRPHIVERLESAARHCRHHRWLFETVVAQPYVELLATEPEQFGRLGLRPAVRHQANGFSSALGPYTDGTGTSSSRKYTSSWPRW